MTLTLSQTLTFSDKDYKLTTRNISVAITKIPRKITLSPYTSFTYSASVTVTNTSGSSTVYTYQDIYLQIFSSDEFGAIFFPAVSLYYDYYNSNNTFVTAITFNEIFGLEEELYGTITSATTTTPSPTTT